MATVVKRLLGAFLSGKGHIFLFILVLAAAAVFRFVWLVPRGIPMEQLSFSSAPGDEWGKILFSDVNKNRFLIARGDSLYWRHGDELRPVAHNLVNVLYSQGRFWLKTQREVSELIFNNGAVLTQLTSAGSGSISFVHSRLVGVKGGCFFLNSGPVVEGLSIQGQAEGPYYLEGYRMARLLEGDWQRGVVLVKDNAWTVFVNFMERERVVLSYEQGRLCQAELSASGDQVIYAVQKGNEVQVWHAKSNGERSTLLYSEEMNFSSMEAVWAPDGSYVAVFVLGFEGAAGVEDTFHSATFLYQPGKGKAMLHKSRDVEIRGLVPTAWDVSESSIWFYWLHEEEPVPVKYTLFRH